MEKLFLFCIVLYCFLSLLFYKKLRGKAYIVPAIPLAVGAAQGIYQLFQSGQQMKAADKAEKYIPPALIQEENLNRLQAGATQYAGQSQDEANVRQGVADTFSNITRATTSSGDVINAASKLDASQSRSLQGIQKTGEIFRQNALDRLRGTMARKAGAQMQSRMYAENLRGAAIRNQYNAISSIGGGAIQAGLADDWNKTFGKNTNPSMMMFNPMMAGMSRSGNNTLPMTQMSDGSFGWSPAFSTHGWNPMAFSVGFNNQ